MSITTNIGEFRVDLVQASDYIAGAQMSIMATVLVMMTREDDGRSRVYGKVSLDLDGVETCEGIPSTLLGDELPYALERYLEVSFDPKAYHMGEYGLLHETGDRIQPSHLYRLVVYAYGTPEAPEFRFVPTCILGRDACREECSREGWL